MNELQPIKKPDEVMKLVAAAYEQARSMRHKPGACSCQIRSGIEDRLAFEEFPLQRFVPVGEFLPCGACLSLSSSLAK